MYADAKRTTSLLRTIGFQMPIELHQSGFIGSISYIGQNVNLEGADFGSIFSETVLRSARDYDETKLSQYRDDSTIYEREFSRIVKEYDKTATKGQTLEQKLSAEAKSHREDNKTWNKEFARLLREYEKSGRNIAKLEAELARKSANYKQSLKDARARAEQDLKEQSQRYKESRRRATERRENAITRKQIKKLLTDLDQRMNRPTEGHYIPKEMRSAVADVLAAIDRTSNRKGSKVNAELLNLSKRYADLAQDKSGGAFSFDKTVSEMLNTIAGYDVPLREMNAEQLANVKLALTAIVNNPTDRKNF